MSDLKQLIKAEALRLGFSHCGVAQAESLESLRPRYSGVIRQKGNSGLRYLETNLEKRLHPELVLEGVKSVIAVLMNYFPQEIIPEDDNFIISKYAYGQDYHQIVRNRLNNLISFIGTSHENLHAKAFVDSGPVLEKTWAQRCGVGWQGKNTLIINKSSGSFFFIGIILADLELEPDPPETDHCGNCDKCVRSCPTNALDIPYQLSISRCISYMTIEQSGEITPQMKNKLNDRIYGCDKCQDVCPFNQYARPHQTPEFLPSEQLMNLRKKDWIALTEADFIRIFVNSPIRRVGIQKLTHNMP